MKKSILTFVLLLMSSFMMAQFRVALHSNGNVTIYGGGNPFTEAYNAAVAGDTIYLPGGNILFPGTIDKALTIKGVGHYPQATTATNKTVLTGNLTIGGNADNLLIEGIHLTGTLTFANNQKADFVTLKRSRFGAIYYQGTGTTPCENNTIRECVIDGDITANNASFLLISNNIFGAGRITGGTQLGISNNVFLRTTYYMLNGITNSSITNNIFMYLNGYPGDFLASSSGNTMNNNVLRMNITAQSNILNNNYVVDVTSVFENVPSSINFDYNQNYALLAAAQTAFLGADGTQVGIYGGIFPFKTNSVPTNPTITAKTIGSNTTANGQLPVQVTVEAQTN